MHKLLNTFVHMLLKIKHIKIELFTGMQEQSLK